MYSRSHVRPHYLLSLLILMLIGFRLSSSYIISLHDDTGSAFGMAEEVHNGVSVREFGYAFTSNIICIDFKHEHGYNVFNSGRILAAAVAPFFSALPALIP